MRLPSSDELATIEQLVELSEQHDLISQFTNGKSTLRVEDMDDGKMGSLRLYPTGVREGSRTFGCLIAEASYTDDDNVPVSVAINVDQNGLIFELDVFKADFSPIRRLPNRNELR
jgi:hypothetical protein